MEPLFDKDSELVGWIDSSLHIFDSDLNWVAYINSGHAWSVVNDSWCGPVSGFLCLDQEGRVVAWNTKDSITDGDKPVRPRYAMRPDTPEKPAVPEVPAKPIIPLRPDGGWSELGFSAWYGQ